MSIKYTSATAITKHDTNPNVYDALHIGGAGDVKVKTAAGETVIFTVVAGQLLELGVQLVYSADTDATAMVGLRFNV